MITELPGFSPYEYMILEKIPLILKNKSHNTKIHIFFGIHVGKLSSFMSAV